MNTLVVKRYVVALWLSFALLFGSGIMASQFGLDAFPTTHACGAAGQHSGGGCS